jgi:hypothetical protein
MRGFVHASEYAIRKGSGAFVMALPHNCRLSYAPELLGQFWDNDRGAIVQSKMHFYRCLDDRGKIRETNDRKLNVSKRESSAQCLSSAAGKIVSDRAAISATLRSNRSHVGQHTASRSHC